MSLLTTSKLSHLGDILAIPFFGILSFYFYQKNNKNSLELMLYGFSVAGFLLDIFFTILWLRQKKRHWRL
jgi:Na+/proline symporter